MDLNKVFKKYFIPSNFISTEKSDICKKCGGECCKNLGCHISPNDLKEITKESIISLIDESGCISIDWWEGNPITGLNSDEKSFFLRMRNLNAKVIDPSFGGHQCSILTDTGCPLSFEYRPKGARDLIPMGGDLPCSDRYPKVLCAADWLPYNQILQEVYNYYYEHDNVTHTPLSDLMDLLNFMRGIK